MMGVLLFFFAFTHLHELTGFFLDQNGDKESSAVQNLDRTPDTQEASGCLTEYYMVIASQLCHELT